MLFDRRTGSFTEDRPGTHNVNPLRTKQRQNWDQHFWENPGGGGQTNGKGDKLEILIANHKMQKVLMRWQNGNVEIGILDVLWSPEHLLEGKMQAMTDMAFFHAKF